MNIIKTVRQMIQFVTIKLVTTKLTRAEVSVLSQQYNANHPGVLDTIQRVEKVNGEKITTLNQWLRFINRNTTFAWRTKEDELIEFSWATTFKDNDLSLEKGGDCYRAVEYPGFPINNRRVFIERKLSRKEIWKKYRVLKSL